MKTLVLVKRHSCIQLGHLYEHLFMAQLKQFFYEKGVYKSLDLATWGMTYEQAGIIEVVCELYSEKAQALADEISQLHIDLGDDNIAVTRQLQAIAAEEPWKLFITDKKEVIDSLKQLDSTPWTHADAIQYIDTRAIRRKNPPLYLTDKKAPRTRILHLNLTLQTDFFASHSELAPLFNVLSRWLLLTIVDQTTIKRGYFAGELSGKYKPLSVSSELLVAPYAGAVVNITTDRNLIANIIQDMTSSEMIERYAEILKNVSYENNFYLAPDTERILTQTGIYIGKAGWQHVATPTTIRNLLSHMELSLSYGRQKEHIRL